MVQFSKLLSEKWEVPETRCHQLCEAFKNGDSALFLIEHKSSISTEIESSDIWGMYAFLNNLNELSGKKKRLISALTKANLLSDSRKKHIEMNTDTWELDDLFLPLRPNPRSKAQLALKKGLGPIADALQAQQATDGTIDDIIQSNLPEQLSQLSHDDIITDVKNILAERFAYDETARSMVRTFCYDDGFIEVTPKEKKDPRFSGYSGKQIPLAEIPKDIILSILNAERTKEVRIKLGVQLFRITELLRHHFITNPDSVAFDLICEAIDEAWNRLLQPIVERDVKARLTQESEDWGILQLDRKIDTHFSSKDRNQIVLSVRIADKNDLVLAVINSDGRLLGATSLKKVFSDKPNLIHDRIRYFIGRHKPTHVIIPDNDQAQAIETVLTKIWDMSNAPATMHIQENQGLDIAQSDWMIKTNGTLEYAIQLAYAAGLTIVQPIALLDKIGTHHFVFDPLQKNLPPEKVDALVARKNAVRLCTETGLLCNDLSSFPLSLFPCLTSDILTALRTAIANGSVGTRSDMHTVKGMTDVIFRNIAGFIVFPDSPNVLDRTLCHPDHYQWITDMTNQLNMSLEELIADPDSIRSADIDDFAYQMFLQKKLMAQLKTGQAYLNKQSISGRPHRRFKLSELTENGIINGKVTNITEFGVFIDINAVCDGLVHISQLADAYVENAEQVVKIGDTIKARILKIDVKKRRISLSMKGLGNDAPKVRPSQGQLSTLADHFKNR